jgi:hypothetical protein
MIGTLPAFTSFLHPLTDNLPGLREDKGQQKIAEKTHESVVNRLVSGFAERLGKEPSGIGGYFSRWL